MLWCALAALVPTSMAYAGATLTTSSKSDRQANSEGPQLPRWLLDNPGVASLHQVHAGGDPQSGLGRGDSEETGE